MMLFLPLKCKCLYYFIRAMVSELSGNSLHHSNDVSEKTRRALKAVSEQLNKDEIMQNLRLTDLEKVALVYMLYALARADGVAAQEEMVCMNRIFYECGISTYLVEVGQLLNEDAACKVVAHMSEDVKRCVGLYLVEVIECDEHGKEPPDVEIDPLNRFAERTGIDIVYDDILNASNA